MEGIKTRKKRLYAIFISFLLRCGVTAVILAALMVVCYVSAARAGVIRMPSYELNQITKVEQKIRTGQGAEEKLLPDTCRYGVFDKDGGYVYGNLSQEEEEKLWGSRHQASVAPLFGSYWKEIERDDGMTVLVEYQVVAKFSNPALRTLFPNAELLLLALYFTAVIVMVVIMAKRQGKYLQKRLDVLSETARKVEREDLDFGREYSDIREVDQVLGALYQMKEALQKSLTKQWEAENRRKEEVAALAHDIKTPLTVIRGNAELLLESEEDDAKAAEKEEAGRRASDARADANTNAECREWHQEILDNAGEIERYLAILQDTLKFAPSLGKEGSHGGEEHLQEKEPLREGESFPAAAWMEEIRAKAGAIGRQKNLDICCDFPKTDRLVQGRQEECSRALWNIISNGADFSPQEGCLLIEVRDTGEYLAVIVSDEGPGFTKEDLLHAADRFYQGDKSRARKDHYGMGLYIASRIMEEQKGSLEIANGENGGGRVSLYFPFVKS